MSFPLPTYQGQTPDPHAATKDAVAVWKTGKIPLVEIFYSLQGEGGRVGQATVFVRLAGCSLACSFCDTDFRVKRALSIEEIITEVTSFGCHWVCLTGGEPTLFDLLPLCDALHTAGFFLQVETNGMHPRPEWRLDHITVSPKETEGGHIKPWYFTYATEFKYVVDDDADIIRAQNSLFPGTIFLQPNALNPAATPLCIAAVQAHPQRFRLSLQTHKLLEIP
nr:7-carboxy-7-deazaguanine synthase QueE [Armatimonas sp.]